MVSMKQYASCRLAVAAMLAAALAAPAAAEAQTLVSTDAGQVQGQLNDGTREFLGIPYAAPPVGPLRFRPPQDVAPWGSPLDATSYPPRCAQLPTLTNSNTRVENEDCLYLNVWTPDPVPSSPLPVMVWIHGGSNTTGSTADFVPFPPYEANRLYDGHFLSKIGNVIVVTINYRLNVFGFFSLDELASEDPGYPHAGNQGLLDQRKALQWVQANIASFGGDPGNVTIFGESAGSFDVCAHVASPMSAGLFHRAISESGGCTVGVSTTEQASAAADAVADAVGCGSAPDRLACLRALPTATLLDGAPTAPDGSGVSLSVDGGFLPKSPREIFDAGENNQVPYILGSNADEGTLFFIGSPELTEEEYSAELVSRYGSFAPEIEATYPASNFDTPRQALIRVWGDATLACSTYDVAKRYSDHKGRVYAYRFSRIPPLAFISFLDLRAFHGLELAYVFGTTTAPTGFDYKLGRNMQGYWSSFAATGKPRVKKQPGWPRFHSKSSKVLSFDATIGKLKKYRKTECDMWTRIYEEGGF